MVLSQSLGYLCVDKIFYVHQVTVSWPYVVFEIFSILMSTSSAVTGRPGSAPEVG